VESAGNFSRFCTVVFSLELLKRRVHRLCKHKTAIKIKM
jgi:hypothetical protein